MNVTRDIQRTKNTPEEYGITSQGQNRSAEWIKKNVCAVFSSSRVDFTKKRQKRKSNREGGKEKERKKKKAKRR